MRDGLVSSIVLLLHVASFKDAIVYAASFKNLREVEVKFARECTYSEHNNIRVKQVAEGAEFRGDLFEVLLDALSPGSKVDSLTIKNVQDYTLDHAYNMEAFAAVWGRLKELALQAVTECYDLRPERSIELLACHGFFHDDL